MHRQHQWNLLSLINLICIQLIKLMTHAVKRPTHFLSLTDTNELNLN